MQTRAFSGMTRHSTAARLERLPISSFHRQIMFALGIVFFFELGDINTFSYAAPAILKEWGLSISGISVIVSATFFGMFLGATSGGWFSDRLGRKKALIYATLWYSVFSLLNAFVWEPMGLFVTRLLTGIGLSAMTVVGMTYISEMFPAAKRGAYQGWVLTIGLIGIPVTAYVARFTVPLAPWGWRLVFIWGSLGALAAALASRLEESPRWLEDHGQHEKAQEALARIEQRVGAECGELPVPREWIPPTFQSHAYRTLFSKTHLRQTVVLLIVWIGQTLGFYGFLAWVPTLLVAHGFSLVNSLAWSSAISIGAIPGALIAALISDRWERKWLITGFALVVAVCGLAYGMSFKAVLIVVFGFCVAMFLQTFAAVLYAYTPETYPTGIRNSGTGLSYGSGRLANAAGPLLVAFFFDHYGYTSVFVYIAVCWLVVAVAMGGFGVRTKGQVLEQLDSGSKPAGA
ncbi:MAG: MFS transporter [Terriglobia bacterium]